MTIQNQSLKVEFIYLTSTFYKVFFKTYQIYNVLLDTAQIIMKIYILPTTSFQELTVVLFVCLLGFLSLSEKSEPWLLSSCLMFSDLSVSLSISFGRPLTWSFLGFSRWHCLPYVLVHLSCNKIPQTGLRRNSRNLLLTLWESGSLRSGAGTVKFK